MVTEPFLPVPMPVVVACLIAAGFGTCLALARMTQAGRFLTRVLVASFLAHVVCALAFYLVSAYQLPVFRDLQLESGFWTISRDAYWYHVNASRMADALRWQNELPTLMIYGRESIVDHDFQVMIAAFYSVFGSHPLYVPLLNSVACIAITATAFVMGRRFAGEAGGRMAAVLVAFWPSFYVWSAQVLKDSLTLLCLMVLLALLVKQIESTSWKQSLITLVVMMLPAFLLLRLRYYSVLLVIGAAIGTGCIGVLIRSKATRIQVVQRTATATLMLSLVFILGRGASLGEWVSPSQPELGRLRKAEYFESRGDMARAREEVRLAEQLRPAPAPPSPPSLPSPSPSGPQAPPVAAEPLQAGRVPLPPPVKPLPLPTRGLREEVRARMGELASTFTAARIMKARRGFETSGGDSLIESDLRIDRLSVSAVGASIAEGIALGLYAPFPWQWFGPPGDTGAFRSIAAIEVVLVVALTPWIVMGMIRAFRSRRPSAWLLVLYAVGSTALLGFAVRNLGILFRLRLLAFLPLLVLLGAYGLAGSRLGRWLARDGDDVESQSPRIPRTGNLLSSFQHVDRVRVDAEGAA